MDSTLNLPILFSFCKNTAFNWRKTSTLLSIMYEVFQRDTRLSTAENDMQKSFAFFEDLLIKHSVQSPPKRSAACSCHGVHKIIAVYTAISCSNLYCTLN
ncbi:hypothetical protein EON63_00740 [archaeon]|nr:MAG: hypothetical protein EON63_00740 [archaeon]